MAFAKVYLIVFWVGFLSHRTVYILYPYTMHSHSHRVYELNMCVEAPFRCLYSKLRPQAEPEMSKEKKKLFLLFLFRCISQGAQAKWKKKKRHPPWVRNRAKIILACFYSTIKYNHPLLSWCNYVLTQICRFRFPLARIRIWIGAKCKRLTEAMCFGWLIIDDLLVCFWQCV